MKATNARLPWLRAAAAAAALSLLAGCLQKAANPDSPPGNRSSDTVSAIAVVRELSAPAYQGRQAGTDGGKLAGEYLAAILGRIGMPPRIMEFRERIPVNVRQARLAVSEPGASVRELEFRRDYREVVRGAWDQAEAEGPLFIMDSPSSPFPRGSILVIEGSGYDNSKDGRLAEQGAAGLLIVLEPEAIEKRATYPGQAPRTMAEPRKGLVKMAVSRDMEKYLTQAAARGARAVLVNPLAFEERTCRNLLASWNGDGGKFEPTVLFMAHYDHVGKDADGSSFPGALDNASGVGLLLTLAENFAIDGRKADVAFLLTDSEEINLSGASEFARNPPFPLAGVAVINLDMVGGINPVRLAVYSNGDGPSLALADELARALTAAGIDASSEYPIPNVDSGPLGYAGARSVTVCEFDQDAYHTKRDTAAMVSASELDLLESALYAFALRLGPKR